MKNLVAVVIFILLPAPVRATEAVLAVGQAALHGDLSKETAAPLYVLQLRRQEPLQDGGGSLTWQPYYGFEVLRATAEAKRTEFPFDEGADLSFLGFFMTPGICVQRGSPAAACAGIGIGTLNVNSRDNRQDFGTWNYEVAVRYPLTESVLMRLGGKKVGDVEQTRQGRAAHFWLTSFLLGFGVDY